MIKYLIAILDKQATSFCYYENPSYNGTQGPVFIPPDKLEMVTDYVIRNKISVNFLYGNHKPPVEYEELIESVNHVKIMPLKLISEINDGIFVINRDDYDKIPLIEDNSHLNLILRLDREYLPKLAEIFHSLLGKFRRLNLCLLHMDEYTEKEFSEYRSQLEVIEKDSVQEYSAGNIMEINFISDRWMLRNMNNCDAGITHLTVAPNGNAYFCPGFYYENEENSIGILSEEPHIKNSQLLRLDYAPICRNCDAYHCKRCVFFKKNTTLELNTPSHQQCVTSHLERNTSARLLETLKPTVELFKPFTDIPPTPYLDPYEILNDISNQKIDPEQGERLIAALLSKPLEKMSTAELLYQVYRLDRELLIRLKNIYGSV